MLVQAPRDQPAVLVADLDLDQRRDWLELFPFLQHAPARRLWNPDRPAAPRVTRSKAAARCVTAMLGFQAMNDHTPEGVRDRRRGQRPVRRQGAGRLGRALHLLRGQRRRRRQLVLPQSQRALLGLPLAAHRHLQDGDQLRDFPLDERYPDFPHHTEIHRFLREYADRFGLREHIRFQTAVEHAEPGPEGGWRIRTNDGRDARVRRPCWSATATTGIPSCPSSPGAFDGETIHSHHYIDPTEPLDLRGKRVVVVGIGNSGVDIVSELSRKGVAERVFISTRSGAWVMPKYAFGRPVDQVFKTNPRLPLGLQRRLAQLLPRIVSGRMESFGLPTPNHRFLEAHPTVSSELLLRLGSGDAMAKPDIAALEGDRVRFADGSVETARRDHLRHRLQDQLPVLRPGLHLGPGNELPPLQADVQARSRQSGLHRLRPRRSPRSSRSPSARPSWPPAGWPATGRRPAPPRWRRRSGPTLAATAPGPTGPRHTMELDFYVYEYDLRKRVLPQGRERARAARR